MCASTGIFFFFFLPLNAPKIAVRSKLASKPDHENSVSEHYFIEKKKKEPGGRHQSLFNREKKEGTL